MNWFGRQGQFELITALSSRGDQAQDFTPNPLIDQEGYTLWNSSRVWADASSRWQVGLHGQNLTDKRCKVSGLGKLNPTLQGTPKY